MFTIGTAAYKLYSASSQVGSTLSTLSSYHKYVTEAIFNSPSEVENLHPLVKQNLDRLARRIQVLSSPLNYCLLWSQHRGSAVAETIHQSKEVLKQTYHWLHICNKDKSKLSDKEYMLKKLAEHIREIDFCLQALNLALSIIQTTNTQSGTNNCNNQSFNISPSSLLTASNRIMAMHNSGGDVAICFGQLFKKSIINTNIGWQRIYRRSALKIYRNGIRRSYELRIECNEYGYNSDDDFANDLMNESFPLTLKFDLTSSIYFTTLSSLIIDLPLHKSFTKSNINLQNLNRNDLIEDAFGWVQMLANQVQEQYIFVLKSGLDDWDQPLSSSDDALHEQQFIRKQKEELQNRHKSHNIIFLKDDGKGNKSEEHMRISDDDTHDLVHPMRQYSNNNSNDIDTKCEEDMHLTASIASLDTAVIQTKRRTHLGSLLAPGGDYDDHHVTPQLMAYMTRLAIYENDYTKPHSMQHTQSTFKKYNGDVPMPVASESNNYKTERDSNDNNGVYIRSGLSKQSSNSNASVTSQSNSSEQSSEVINECEYDTIDNEEFALKEQLKIPAHLLASDEELYLFLRNPPTPPIPFYPNNVRFTNANENSESRKYHSQRSKHRKYKSKAKNNRSQSNMRTRKSFSNKSKSPNKSDGGNSNNKSYFAAPNAETIANSNVTITYSNHNNLNEKIEKNMREPLPMHSNNVKNDGNLSLSISDENHMKYLRKNKDKSVSLNTDEISPKTKKKSMAAIKDATNSSLLDNVDMTASQMLSAVSSPRNERIERSDSVALKGNFANLSIDND